MRVGRVCNMSAFVLRLCSDRALGDKNFDNERYSTKKYNPPQYRCQQPPQPLQLVYDEVRSDQSQEYPQRTAVIVFRNTFPLPVATPALVD